jgi:hypothetical protein
MHSPRITVTAIALALLASACAVDTAPDDELGPDGGSDEIQSSADDETVELSTGCTHSTGLYKYNGYNHGWATVSCSTTKSTINVNIWLTRNGNFATFPIKEKACSNTKTCTVKIYKKDDSGSDFWCTRSRYGVPFYTDNVQKTCHYL